MIIGDDYKVDFSVDGANVDLFANGFLSKAKIIEKVSTNVPTLQLELGDAAASTEPFPVYDGMQVIIGIENLQTGLQHSMPFRLFYYGADQNKTPTEMALSTYYDAPDIFKNAQFAHLDGKSADVAKLLADASGLTSDIDPTTDNQVWIRSGITGGTWLSQVAEHAYRSDKSCYTWALTRQGELRFYNLTTRKRKPAAWIFSDNPLADTEPTSNIIELAKPIQRSNTGLLNKWRGYGVYASQYKLLTGQKEDVFIDEVDKSTGALGVNAEMAEPSRYLSGPIDSGNTHENYFRAKVQNQLNLAMYSSDLQVDANSYRDVALLDRIEVGLSSDAQAVLAQPASGAYFVDAIVTVITSQSLRSRYNFTREGFNPGEDIGALY